MIKLFFLALILCLSTATVYAQTETDLSGVWTGTLFQNEGGIAERFELYFDLEQIGPAIKGKAYVRLGDLYAEMKLSGYRTGSGGWRITETEILRSDKAGLAVSWCMKQYELRVDYREGNWVLNGPWWGSSEYGTCIPGTITLRRKGNIAWLPVFGGQHPVYVQAHRQVHHRDHPLHGGFGIGSDEHAVAGIGLAG